MVAARFTALATGPGVSNRPHRAAAAPSEGAVAFRDARRSIDSLSHGSGHRSRPAARHSWRSAGGNWSSTSWSSSPARSGIGPQMRQLLGNQEAIRVRTVVQHAGPEGDLGPKPLAGPLAPPRPLRFAEPGPVRRGRCRPARRRRRPDSGVSARRSGAGRGDASKASAYRRAAATGCPWMPQSSANSRVSAASAGLSFPSRTAGRRSCRAISRSQRRSWARTLDRSSSPWGSRSRQRRVAASASRNRPRASSAWPSAAWAVNNPGSIRTAFS